MRSGEPPLYQFESASQDERAQKYHEFASRFTAWTIPDLLDAAGVTHTTAVLDVGTGPGYAAAQAKVRGAGVVGVDIADEMLALARRLHRGIEFREASAEQLPFADASFDSVIGNFVVLHLDEPERAAREFWRVLRPGGRVALTTWDIPERQRFFGAMLDALQSEVPPDQADLGYPPMFRFADTEQFTRLLEGAGFQTVAVRELPHTHEVGSAADVWEFYTKVSERIGGIVRPQTVEVQERIRARLDRLLAPYAAEHGCEIPADAKLALGRKSTA